jgi:hypothetical protein
LPLQGDGRKNNGRRGTNQVYACRRREGIILDVKNEGPETGAVAENDSGASKCSC